MKRYLNINLFVLLMLMAGTVPILTSCEDEEGAPPILERVSLVPKDSTTNEGFRGNTYVIFGQNLATTKAVLFNGATAPLNTTFVRNDNIIIRIGNNAPYVQAMNKVTVVTEYGEASMDFVVKQRPVISTFFPAVAAGGEIVTIVGNYFDGLESVTFTDVATGTVTTAEVVSAKITELKVVVPDGTKVSTITVTTPSGKASGASTFGLNYIIYTDALQAPWENWSWSSTIDFASPSVVKSGQYAWKQTYTGGWGGIQMHHGSLDLSQFTALKFSIYGGPGTGGKEIMVFINWAKEYRITLEEGKWVDYTIPLSELNATSGNLGELILQDVGNVGVTAPYLIYIDDVGFL